MNSDSTPRSYGSINNTSRSSPIAVGASSSASSTNNNGDALSGSPLENIPYSTSYNVDNGSSSEETPEPYSETTPILGSPSAGSLLQHPIDPNTSRHKRKLSWSSVMSRSSSSNVEIKENKYSARAPIESTSINNPSLESRMKYYAKLHRRLIPPDHVIPKSFFVPFMSEDKKQSSLVTIFSIWNTMIGSSLLTMPYAIMETGWVLSFFVMALMCGLCCYTCVLILRYDQGNGINGKIVEFTEISNIYFGKWGSYLCLFASVGVFGGALCGYCVLLATFLKNIGDTIFFWAFDCTRTEGSLSSAASSNTDDICDTIAIYWSTTNVTIAIMLILFPLTLVKEFGIIAKLTSVGTVSVIYMICFTIYIAADSGLKYSDAEMSGNYFYYFMGILTLSFFIHNAILNITRNNRNPADRKSVV